MTHPNATVALVAGSGGGTLAAYLLDDVAHLGLSAAACAAIAGGVASVALFVGRRGLRGVWQQLVNGTDSTPPTVVATKPRTRPKPKPKPKS